MRARSPRSGTGPWKSIPGARPRAVRAGAVADRDSAGSKRRWAPLQRNTKLQPLSPYGWYQLGRVQHDLGADRRKPRRFSTSWRRSTRKSRGNSNARPGSRRKRREVDDNFRSFTFPAARAEKRIRVPVMLRSVTCGLYCGGRESGWSLPGRAAGSRRIPGKSWQRRQQKHSGLSVAHNHIPGGTCMQLTAEATRLLASELEGDGHPALHLVRRDFRSDLLRP